MRSRTLVIMLTCLLLAVAAIGTGYAYTSSTDNADNNASSEYVVLKQNNYNFGEADITFSTITRMNSQGTGPETVIVWSTQTTDIRLNDTDYLGVKVGNSDQLSGTVSLPEKPDNLQVNVQSVEGTFTDFHDLNVGWLYVIKVTLNGNSQYVWWNGHTEQWQGTIVLAMDDSDDSPYETETYTTELFIAIPQNGLSSIGYIPSNLIENGTVRFIYSMSEQE
jgi:hypothetical protein